MANEIYKLQEDPPEGSRKTIDRELQRQAKKESDKADDDGSDQGRSPSAGAEPPLLKQR